MIKKFIAEYWYIGAIAAIVLFILAVITCPFLFLKDAFGGEFVLTSPGSDLKCKLPTDTVCVMCKHIKPEYLLGQTDISGAYFCTKIYPKNEFTGKGIVHKFIQPVTWTHAITLINKGEK